MSSPIAFAPLAAQGILNQTHSAPSPTGSFNAQDVQRLRQMVSDVPTPANVTQAQAPGQVSETQKPELMTLGDSILNGITSFNSGYHDSLSKISQKIDSINDADALNLGNNFADIMTLQVEVARWSMSVTGVDNASKAGTNTIKELSKGG